MRRLRRMLPLLVTAALLTQTPQSPTEQAPSPPTEPTGVVVATQSDPLLVERLSLIKNWNSAMGVSVLSTTEFLRRLTGIGSPKLIDPNETRLRLDQAQEYEDYSDSKAAAEARRDVMFDFESSVLPSAELATLAARSLQGAVAAAIYKRNGVEARMWAREARMRFPHVPLDAKASADVAKVFKQAEKDVAPLPQTKVTFTSTMPGHVFVNGRDLGLASPRLAVSLRQGGIRVWVADDTATSLVHAFVAASQPLDIAIDFELESKFAFQPIPTLRCASDCDGALQRLAKAASVDQAIGLELIDNAEVARGRYVKADDGATDTRVIAALAAPGRLYVSDTVAATQPPQLYLQPPTTKPFSPMLFVPFGGGQCSQKRYVACSVYAGIQVGLAAWSISTVARFHNENLENARSLGQQHNLATGLLIGAMAANIAEALIVHALSD